MVIYFVLRNGNHVANVSLFVSSECYHCVIWSYISFYAMVTMSLMSVYSSLVSSNIVGYGDIFGPRECLQGLRSITSALARVAPIPVDISMFTMLTFHR